MRGTVLFILEIFPFIVNAVSLVAGILLYFWLKIQRGKKKDGVRKAPTE